MTKKEMGYYWLLIFRLVFLVGIVVHKELILQSGHEVQLKILPRDPRSLLQGDYVILTYEFVRDIPKEQPLGPLSVVLKPNSDGPNWRFGRIFRPGDTLGNNEVLLRGRKTQKGFDFGIGQYFVEAGTGRELERSMSVATIKVSPDGEAVVTHVK